MKLCTSCGETKPLDEFYRAKSGRRRGKIIARCKPCHRDANRRHERGRRDRPRERDKRATYRHRLRERYGLEFADFEALLIAQAGRCGACSAPMTAPEVDHCHDSEAVRGLLCHGCNTAAGMAGDDPARLRQIAAYLEAP